MKFSLPISDGSYKLPQAPSLEYKVGLFPWVQKGRVVSDFKRISLRYYWISTIVLLHVLETWSRIHIWKLKCLFEVYYSMRRAICGMPQRVFVGKNLLSYLWPFPIYKGRNYVGKVWGHLPRNFQYHTWCSTYCGHKGTCGQKTVVWSRILPSTLLLYYCLTLPCILWFLRKPNK